MENKNTKTSQDDPRRKEKSLRFSSFSGTFLFCLLNKGLAAFSFCKLYNWP